MSYANDWYVYSLATDLIKLKKCIYSNFIKIIIMACKRTRAKMRHIDPSLLLLYFLASPVAFPFPCLVLPVSLPCLFP